jgi:tetratricopeptide (TPR) repeat protein
MQKPADGMVGESPLSGGGTRYAVVLGAAFIVLAALLSYSNSFGCPFLFDDIPSIFENPSVKTLWPLSVPLSPPALFGMTVGGRPLVNLSVAINQAISGSSPWSYHVFNLLVHGLAGLVLFGLLRRLLSLPSLASGLGRHAWKIAFVSALLWTAHPLQTEAVTYIIQRAESMMGLFFLLTLYCFARALGPSPCRQSAWLSASVLCAFLGAACKEVMVMAPPLVLLLDRSLASGSFLGSLRKRPAYYACLFACWILLFWLVLKSGGDRGGTFQFTPAAFFSYWGTQFEAISRYLWLSLCPYPLVFDYGTVREFHPVTLFASIVVVTSLLSLTLWAVIKKRPEGILGAFFFLVLAPTSLMPGLYQVIVEHRMYLPLASVTTLLACLIVPRLGSKALWYFAACGLLLIGLTFLRNTDYASDLSIWKDSVQKRPQSSIAWGNLGVAYDNRNQFPEALRCFEESLKLDPKSHLALYNIGRVHFKKKRYAQAEQFLKAAIKRLPYFVQAHTILSKVELHNGEIEAAVESIKTALSYSPDSADAQHALGLICAARHLYPEAEKAYLKAIKCNPDFPDAESDLGLVLTAMGRHAEALEHLDRAVKLLPQHADLQYNLAMALLTAGREEEAILHYRKAVENDSEHFEARLNLGILLAQKGHYPEAKTLLQEAKRIRPEAAEAHLNLGIVLAQCSQNAEAIAEYGEALRLKPNYPSAHYNLGNALLNAGKTMEAYNHFSEALRIDPNYEPALEMLQQMGNPAR